MARKALIENNLRKEKLIKSYHEKRKALKEVIYKKDDSPEAFKDRISAMIKLTKMPRNSSLVRYRNRCSLTGRGRGYYRDFGISRVSLRELASYGKLPGVRKSSW